MTWHSIDAVDTAFKRTKSALIEPFNFWKWIKLGIIIFLLGGSVGGGGGGGGSNFGGTGQSFNGIGDNGESLITDSQFLEYREMFTQFLNTYLTYLLLGIGFFIGIILLLSYISNVMEFVFVNSLVTNVVAFRAYTRQYLRQGFNLFMIRFVLGLVFLSILIISMLPVVLSILDSQGNFNVGMFIGGMFLFVGVLLILAIVSGIIESFINLSIPMSMYQNTGIIAAFKKVLGLFKADWKQIIVYWVVRFFLGIIVGIILALAALIIFIVVFGIVFMLGLILYLLLSWAGLGIEDAVFWVIMAPFGLVAFVLLFVFSLLVSVPVPVFMKYHMLTFLKSWYPESGIPLFELAQEKS
ncbi:MAG: hypothetical protein C5S40_06655 [ANME-2 cluster archaeon]|nr:hypothetical protein [ANME-2 cluster archaeon]